MRTEINEHGQVTVQTETSTWFATTPDQAEKHLPTWTDQRRDGNGPAPVITSDDVAAIRDCAQDARKQLKETGIRRITASLRYVNVESIKTIKNGERT
jgi:hypothetical protein